MRLDAARLKGCFGSWIPLWSCYLVNQSANSERLEEPAALTAGFFVSGVHSTAPWIEDLALDPENIEKSALGSFRGPIIQFQPVVYPCLGTKRGSAEERPSDERNELVP